jgi:hypothetical protein
MGSSNACVVVSGEADHAQNVIEVWTALAEVPAPQGSVIDAQNLGRRPLPAARPKHAPAHSRDLAHSAVLLGLF